MRERVLDGDDEGPRWSFMRRKIIGDGHTIYMKRLYILATPWFGFMFHRLYRPDQQRDLHDHPWSFLSIILRGFYRENTPEGIQERRWFNWKSAEDRHSIRFVSRIPVWTFVITGPRRRKWGFWVPVPCGDRKYHEHMAECPPGHEKFIPFDEYEKLNDA